MLCTSFDLLYSGRVYCVNCMSCECDCVSGVQVTSTELEYVTAGCYWLTDRPGDGSWPMGAEHCPVWPPGLVTVWSLLVSSGGPGRVVTSDDQWSVRGRDHTGDTDHLIPSNHQQQCGGTRGNWATHYAVASWQPMVLSFCHWFLKVHLISILWHFMTSTVQLQKEGQFSILTFNPLLLRLFWQCTSFWRVNICTLSVFISI